MRVISFLPTRDLDAVHEFWTRVGAPCVLDQGGCRIYRVAAKTYYGFCTHLAVPVPADGIIACLVLDTVAEVDAAHRRFTEAGLVPDAAPREYAKFRLYHFFVPMPDGYRLEIQAFLHPFDEAASVTTS
jgi:catechol 2,3-dioxygenase-like lactoylglutathione lyase family enzyme